MESSVSSTSALVSDVHSDKIIVHLVEGFRTVIVDDQVQFRSVIKSITERLTKQAGLGNLSAKNRLRDRFSG